MPKDSEELHDIPLLLDVRVTKRRDTGELANAIRAYSSRETRAVEAATEPGKEKAPWEK